MAPPPKKLCIYVCMRDPRIIAQSSDPRFAQQNPRMVRICTLRLTYIWAKLNKSLKETLSIIMRKVLKCNLKLFKYFCWKWQQKYVCMLTSMHGTRLHCSSSMST